MWFKSITKKKFCDSSIPDFRIPCHIYGKSKKYNNLNNILHKKNNLIHTYKNGKYKILNFLDLIKSINIINYRSKKR